MESNGVVYRSVPIGDGYTVILHWRSDDDTVEIQVGGQVVPGLSWDDFIRRINWLTTERDAIRTQEAPRTSI